MKIAILSKIRIYFKKKIYNIRLDINDIIKKLGINKKGSK